MGGKGAHGAPGGSAVAVTASADAAGVSVPVPVPLPLADAQPVAVSDGVGVPDAEPLAVALAVLLPEAVVELVRVAAVGVFDAEEDGQASQITGKYLIWHALNEPTSETPVC